MFDTDIKKLTKEHDSALGVFHATKQKLDAIMVKLQSAVERRATQLSVLNIKADKLNNEVGELHEYATTVRHSLNKIEEFLA